MAKDSSTLSQPEASSSKSLPVAKLTAVGRFKSFTGSLVSKRRKAPEYTFPPPSWSIEDFNPSSTNWTIPEPEPEPRVESTGAKVPETVEPVTFAKRLRAMIEMLPLPGILAQPPTSGATPNETPVSPPPASLQSPPPVPPGMDENLMRMLSSEEVMNGDTKGKGKGRPGIWNILAGLGRSNNADEVKGDDKSILSVEDQNSGVMMYAPLDPESDSQVELASTQTIQQPASEAGPSNSTSQLPVESSIWVPSTTQLSVLTSWWGYRLYLPPPVMSKLGSTSVKAAGRAAMITSALKWLIDKIPLMLIPPQFRPAIKMLKNLAPFVGYVGVFIAWSWDRIRTFDEGNGVVLTATWILPVALIPMAWDAGDIYGPRLQSDVEAAEGSKELNGNDQNVKDNSNEATAQPKKETKKSRF